MIVCDYYGSETAIAFFHDGCKAERNRRVNDGLCQYCGELQATDGAILPVACGQCNGRGDTPQYLGLSGGLAMRPCQLCGGDIENPNTGHVKYIAEHDRLIDNDLCSHCGDKRDPQKDTLCSRRNTEWDTPFVGHPPEGE